jgi:hypothetical protein
LFSKLATADDVSPFAFTAEADCKVEISTDGENGTLDSFSEQTAQNITVARDELRRACGLLTNLSVPAFQGFDHLLYIILSEVAMNWQRNYSL